MNRILYISLMIIASVLAVNGQRKNTIVFQLSTNQVEIDYQRKLFTPNTWGEIYFGLGNQDITNSLNDIVAGLRAGTGIISKGKNRLDVNIDFGIYMPNNSYYNASAPTLAAGLRYNRFFGKTRKHSIVVSAGYRYGKRSYKQKYKSEIITIEHVGEFKISPLYISIGYGFSFN
ncbi:MAG: hypothetical protein N4A72_19010 [Bacteroidales bacterium]|nr:hypothetical protein [Bacteroidales bacterium]